MRFRVLIDGVNEGVVVCLGVIEAENAEEALEKIKEGRRDGEWPWGCWLEETAEEVILMRPRGEGHGGAT